MDSPAAAGESFRLHGIYVLHVEEYLSGQQNPIIYQLNYSHIWACLSPQVLLTVDMKPHLGWAHFFKECRPCGPTTNTGLAIYSKMYHTSLSQFRASCGRLGNC